MVCGFLFRWFNSEIDAILFISNIIILLNHVSNTLSSGLISPVFYCIISQKSFPDYIIIISVLILVKNSLTINDKISLYSFGACLFYRIWIYNAVKELYVFRFFQNNISSCSFKPVHDFRVVQSSQKSERDKMVYSGICKLGNSLFWIYDSGSG